VNLKLFAFLLAICLYSSVVKAEGQAEDSGWDVGLSLAMPTLGVSFQKVLSTDRTFLFTVGNGAQAQLNFTGDSHLGNYFLIGAGRDRNIGLVRLGYGRKWQVNAWSFHIEAAINAPVWDRDLGGLADLAKIVYFFPIGFGAHYGF